MQKSNLTLSDLQTRLDDLECTDIPYDLVQRGFVQALLIRTHGKNDIVQQTILQKAAVALDRYDSLNYLKHKNATQTESESSTSTQKNLLSLIELLDNNSRQLSSETSENSLEELMACREKDIISLAKPLPTPAKTTSTKTTKKTRNSKKPVQSIPKDSELKATRQARKAIAIDKACKIVDDINIRKFANPGPLNPQMLATRAITMVRNLSPAYLNRFMTLMDTLHWLETTNERIETKK